VEKIEVRLNSLLGTKNDAGIAKELFNSFEWNWRVPKDKIKITVEGGWITMEGELLWLYETDAERDAVKNLLGFNGVSNNIRIKSESGLFEKADIGKALKRHWCIYDINMNVQVAAHKATLTGTVGSWCQKNEGSRIAGNAPGI